MDSYTPGWACITACVIVLIALLGTPLVEAIVGQKYRPFDPLDAARIAGVPTWWAVLWLFIVGILVAVAQLAFVAALLDSRSHRSRNSSLRSSLPCSSRGSWQCFGSPAAELANIAPR
jgi:hypothetical protein